MASFRFERGEIEVIVLVWREFGKFRVEGENETVGEIARFEDGDGWREV